MDAVGGGCRFMGNKEALYTIILCYESNNQGLYICVSFAALYIESLVPSFSIHYIC